MGKKLIKNIGRLVTMVAASDREGPLGVICDAALLIEGEKIAWLGCSSGLKKQSDVEVINAGQGVVLPGFVDCHTHLVHAGSRENEFGLRAAGASYEEIAASGGGILSTVEATRCASEEELYQISKKRADEALAKGLTTIEIKTGYGLSLDSELKMLSVIDRLRRNHPLRVVATFMGAHTIPKEFKENRDAYLDLVINKMLPEVVQFKFVKFIDVFLERGVFTKEEAKSVLEAGAQFGLKPRLHVDQLHDGGGASFAAQMGAISADHLDYTSDAGVAALKKSGTAAILLPGATFFLGCKQYPPARKFLEAGVPVALSTDYNPGTHPALNPFWLGTIAATQMQMSMDEILPALTKTPAKILGLDKTCGSLASGMSADFTLLNCRHEYYPFYRYDLNCIEKVFLKGAPLVIPAQAGIQSMKE